MITQNTVGGASNKPSSTPATELKGFLSTDLTCVNRRRTFGSCQGFFDQARRAATQLAKPARLDRAGTSWFQTQENGAGAAHRTGVPDCCT